MYKILSKNEDGSETKITEFGRIYCNCKNYLRSGMKTCDHLKQHVYSKSFIKDLVVEIKTGKVAKYVSKEELESTLTQDEQLELVIKKIKSAKCGLFLYVLFNKSEQKIIVTNQYHQRFAWFTGNKQRAKNIKHKLTVKGFNVTIQNEYISHGRIS